MGGRGCWPRRPRAGSPAAHQPASAATGSCKSPHGRAGHGSAAQERSSRRPWAAPTNASASWLVGMARGEAGAGPATMAGGRRAGELPRQGSSAGMGVCRGEGAARASHDTMLETRPRLSALRATTGGRTGEARSASAGRARERGGWRGVGHGGGEAASHVQAAGGGRDEEDSPKTAETRCLLLHDLDLGEDGRLCNGGVDLYKKSERGR
jgi:hypothetical protein